MPEGNHIGLKYNLGPVLAKAPGKVLIGGLGALGVGQMWVKEEPYHKNRPGYDEAPIVEDPDA